MKFNIYFAPVKLTVCRYSESLNKHRPKLNKFFFAFVSFRCLFKIDFVRQVKFRLIDFLFLLRLLFPLSFFFELEEKFLSLNEIEKLITENSLNIMTKVVMINIRLHSKWFFLLSGKFAGAKELEKVIFLQKGSRKGCKVSLLQMS